MNTNPLLEEIWNTKARLDADAGGDLHVLCEQTQHWSALHLPQGFALQSASEIRQLLAQQQSQTEPLLREESPPYPATPPKRDGP